MTNAGTEVSVLGYEPDSSPSYDFGQIKKYLYFSTIVGHTRPREMPTITLKVNDTHEILSTGFPYLNVPSEPDWRTYVLAPIVRKTTVSGQEVAITLKGGFTLETGDHALTGAFTLTPSTSGLFLSIKGIPYLALDLNQFKGNFSGLQYKFCRFVAECDALFDQMDFARMAYQPGLMSQAFEKLLRESFNELAERPEWKLFVRERERQQQMRNYWSARTYFSESKSVSKTSKLRTN